MTLPLADAAWHARQRMALAVVEAVHGDHADLTAALVPLVRSLTTGRGAVLEAAVAAMGSPGLAAGPWVGVGSRMPTDGVLCLVFGTEHGFPILGRTDAGTWVDERWNHQLFGVTHWAPLYGPGVPT